MSFSYYGELCTEIYDLTKKTGQTIGGDIEFYRQKLQSCEGRVLEVMVGSGRVMIPLLEAGIAVDGMDYSAEMLDSCRTHCEARGLQPNLYQSSLQELSLPHLYEAIIIPAGSFLLIENREQSLEALRTLYRHLQPGGRLLLDLFLPDTDFDTNRPARTSTYTLPNGDTITMEDRLAEVDFFQQYKVNHLRYEKWRNGALLQTELQRLAVRWYGVEEFRLILKDIGFPEVSVIADFNPEKPPSSQHQTFVYEARK